MIKLLILLPVLLALFGHATAKQENGCKWNSGSCQVARLR